MRRREFLGFLGGAAACPVIAQAQQPAMPVVGFLAAGSLQGYANQAVAFRQGLSEEGFVPGQNVAIEYRWADGRYERLPALATELIQRHVAVLYSSGGFVSLRAALAARATPETTPIVFTTAVDPITSGMVKSLSRPEGNITGASYVSGTLSGKRLELIRELLPNASKIAALRNPNNPSTDADEADLKAAAKKLGLNLTMLYASTVEQVNLAFSSFDQQRPDALVMMTDLFFTSNRDRILDLTARYRMPAIYSQELITKAGGLMSYGASPIPAYRQAGVYVGRILKGAKPADLPVLLPNKFELVVNLKTAKALGLNIPEAFLLYRADEVIE